MANISVLNTNAQLSGKTLTTAEGDWTVSGAWTFSGNQTFTGNVTIGNATTDTVTITSTITSSLIFTDATYDIGASGATRPRDLFLSRNAAIGGTLAVTGAATFDGAVTLGNAAADAVTVTGTLASNLIFTDATYDIGASGATRPRDLFLSRNAVIGGNLTGGGAFVMGATQAYSTDADVNDLALNAGTSLLVGDGATVPRTITGLTGGATGRVVLFLNRSGSSYLFPNDSGSSSAANQFRTANSATVTVRTNGSATLAYYNGRWHVGSV